MSKLNKYLNLALNNSSASEAATALKMAANEMQKEKINPSAYLQPKGASTCNHASEIQGLKDDYNGLASRFNKLLRAYNANKAELNTLKSQSTYTESPKAKPGAYDDILKDIDHNRNEDNPQRIKTRQIYNNLVSYESRLVSRLRYEKHSANFPNGYTALTVVTTKQEYQYALYVNTYGKYVMKCFVYGPRGGYKDTLTWTYDNEHELISAFFKRPHILKN